MKGLLNIFTLLALASCGGNTEYVANHHTKYKDQDFEGIYFFDELGGKVELIETSQGLVNLRTLVEISSLNPENETLGYFPKFHFNNVKPNVNNEIVKTFSKDFDNSHDIEEDNNGDNVRGDRRVDLTLQVKDDDSLKVNIKVYSGGISNPNFIVVDRDFTGTK